jgi:hypothetical protein
MTELRDAALNYAARGLAVLSLVPGGKKPLGLLVRHGCNDASNDADQIHSSWDFAPLANVGLATGIHFDVLDIDGPDALETLMSAGAAEPGVEGPTVATPRGSHRYVAATAESQVDIKTTMTREPSPGKPQRAMRQVSSPATTIR